MNDFNLFKSSYLVTSELSCLRLLKVQFKWINPSPSHNLTSISMEKPNLEKSNLYVQKLTSTSSLKFWSHVMLQDSKASWLRSQELQIKIHQVEKSPHLMLPSRKTSIISYIRLFALDWTCMHKKTSYAVHVLLKHDYKGQKEDYTKQMGCQKWVVQLSETFTTFLARKSKASTVPSA